MKKYTKGSLWLLFGAALTFFVFLLPIIYYSYANPFVRLEHFSYLFGIIGSIATALTLYRLVVERKQLQKEKSEEQEHYQARRVNAWLALKRIKGSKLPIQVTVINNSSNTPVFGAVISIVDARDPVPRGEETLKEFQQVVDLIPPGSYYLQTPQGYGGMGFHASIEVSFTDAKGVSWSRRGNGKLEKLKQSPLEHYRVDLPPTYESLSPF